MMLNWFMEQTVILTLFCLPMMVFHRVILAKIGAHYTYVLWSSVPILLLISVGQLWFPEGFMHLKLSWLSLPEPAAVMQHYQVLATDTIKLSSMLISSLYLDYLYIAIMSLLLLSMVYQQTQFNPIVASAVKVAETNKGVDILAHESVQSPMLVGLLSPCILVPLNFKSLDINQQQAIIAHEAFHHQRKDLWCNVIGCSVLLMFWFNPLMWFAYRRFRHDQELSCDAQVTSEMDKNNKIAYSHALLAYSQHVPLSMLHTHYGDKTILKERIIQMKKQHGKNTLVIMGITLALGISGLIINQQVHAGSQAKQAETHVVPTMRIDPIYPAKAATAGLNGYVQLEFDISQSGKVSNVAVIKSSPTGVFDQSAKDALSQWVYNESENGVKNAQVQLDFVIHEPAADVERIKVN
ncbi:MULTISPECIES: M56 family metallopeptidase [unclassified Shewanella]|uniref:M56 family metallopeptidase n=1 Tax=unclassified Shewanella TaxID=196818 RepID=UPI001F537C9E|nr:MULTISPECIES: M56 family metallopeptidase [unclassified Shewanella]MDO6620490.1 M56 family metallopeptidase [Shewanella sp. 6_MG-2023]MDO6641457.1 M56 family metallopeptidase [Shewanella sp. 5_MG-2023]MDO6679589.1 M56 family metallopeptidase [Shewanella sp. 4_MG-2023]MDO6776550.1 M56 family metallopeptidase [Shewanella sp. 3_MG-2023]